MDGTGSALFDRIDASGSKLLSAYFPVCDPLVPLDYLKIYDEFGVDLIELGIKSANPHHDGDTIRQSMLRSTGQGRLADAGEALRMTAGLAGGSLGVIFAYPQPGLAEETFDWTGTDILLCAGADGSHRERLVSDAKSAGVSTAEFAPHHMREGDLARARSATSYVFLQYAAGKTGIRAGFDRSAKARLQRLRQSGVSVPVLLGVGLSTPDQCRHALDCGADGIVIGSKTVKMAEKGRAALSDYLGEIRQVIDGR
ncbi:tryptophan synthase subunit alpha [Nitratireductor sp. XY-223]|uniref:tryptophan synthase subunit alpha n=1 Tax=Nitratireductor sp. XY-223 TaxID=2561926 RepID=UPI0010AAF96C|nr:tryptophan synthase subunit alpha [Nitratireductor sp. XY-223]